MKLVHHSHTRITEVISVPQLSQDKFRDIGDWGKPRGLWFETDGGWADYCRAVDRKLGRFRYEVTLQPDANILHIGTGKAFDEFTALYGAGSPIAAMLDNLIAEEPREDLKQLARDLRVERYADGFPEHDAIDWPRVAAEYQGIIIHPYLGSRRMSRFGRWYYLWDVASGCVWDAAAVKSFKPVARAKRKARAV
jgi:hypothetical protein